MSISVPANDRLGDDRHEHEVGRGANPLLGRKLCRIHLRGARENVPLESYPRHSWSKFDTAGEQPRITPMAADKWGFWFLSAFIRVIRGYLSSFGPMSKRSLLSPGHFPG